MPDARDGNPGPRKWTAEPVVAEARKYRTRSEFKAGSGSAYQAMRRLEIVSECSRGLVLDEGIDR